ncbi:MAG: dehydrogenase [Candidatus Hinthialibacteria bacterium]
MNDLSRRGFIKASMGSLAALSMARKATAASMNSAVYRSVVGANDRIRLGAIGTGGMGKGDIMTFLKFDDVDCVAVCDVDSSRMAEAAKMVEDARGKRPDEVKDWRHIIDRKDVDAVLVATPDHWHALPTIAACEVGKDVYCEKPLATSIGEGRAMVKAALAHKRVVQMGTQWRSAPHMAAAVEYIQSGKLGKIRLVRCWAYLEWIKNIGNPADAPVPEGVDYDMWLGPAPKRTFNPGRFHFNFRWFWDYAGGLMTDWGVHLLNIALWAMDPPAPLRVTSAGGKYVWDDLSETPDTQHTLYQFPDFTLIWEHEAEARAQLDGREHGVCFHGQNGSLTLWSNGWEVLPGKDSGLEPEKHEDNNDSRPAHVRNFLDCMRSRQKPVEDVETGHYVSSIAHLGNMALLSKDVVEWNPKLERVWGNPAANRLVTKPYRAPWKLPV